MIHTRVKAEGLREKLATILSQEYKELAIQDLKVIGTGVQNIVFQGDSEKGSLAFRVPWEREVENINEDLFNSRISLQKEAELSKYCHSKGIPVPRIHGLHLSTELDFLISDCVYADHMPISACKIGELVSNLHSMPIDGLYYKQKPISKYIAERIVKRIEGFNTITNCKINLPDTKTIEYILSTADHVKCLLHMDIRPANLIGYNGEVKAIVDWDNALIGHPLLELMRIAETNEVSWDEFKDGYKNDSIFNVTPHIVSLFYRLDTAVMLANLFIAHLKIKDKGVFYKERVKALHHDIYKNL
ncbi:phosphotransferase [Bacillus cereus]|uniref:Aminoglycoside phosphotransferase n=1 Tax=Bacillus thuringiensis subsp. medellin TaxID=79672 RepID=A0A9X6RG94_BACTV|nr:MULTISPECIES: phosphotransferase [Bacillus]KUF30325.1 aminoglycoside phosphotransferase [Bacillus sp. G3(2015)]MBE5088415.1 phosphotransferase [Bacillus thuringiensis]MEB9377222.1 phosphotransferase [Bacillus cereus]NRQ68699.1 phosphotransferase [Bacillus cereus]OUB97729.1 aminoglycoside phosphotransferase [Bacillus thuringiensis serovar medellin]